MSGEVLVSGDVDPQSAKDLPLEKCRELYTTIDREKLLNMGSCMDDPSSDQGSHLVPSRGREGEMIAKPVS